MIVAERGAPAKLSFLQDLRADRVAFRVGARRLVHHDKLEAVFVPALDWVQRQVDDANSRRLFRRNELFVKSPRTLEEDAELGSSAVAALLVSINSGIGGSTAAFITTDSHVGLLTRLSRLMPSTPVSRIRTR